MTSRYFPVMSHRDDVYQAIPFEVSYEANEPLIAAAGDADAEEEDHRLVKKAFSRFKFFALLLGLLLGFLLQFLIHETRLLLITFWGGSPVIKTKTIVFVFSLFWCFFTAAMFITCLLFLRKLVTINYSAAGGYSKDLIEGIVLHVDYCFGAGSCLAWNMAGVILGVPAQTECALAMLVVVLFWYKIEMMCFATDSNPPFSPRRSTAEETMTAV
jgi:hypothetical protein